MGLILTSSVIIEALRVRLIEGIEKWEDEKLVGG